MTTNEKVLIKVENLQKSFEDNKVLDGISTEIRQGEVVAVIGPSGSGKTTLMNIVGCLDQATSGRLILDGQDISKCSDNQMSDIRLQKIGFVFQNFQLLARQSAMENVCLPLTYAGVPKKERRERAALALERVGLGDRMSFNPTQLSGGQKQRVAIARALATDPKVLLCDEATSALDPTTTASILALLKDLNEKLGVTVVVITHQMSVIEEICSRVAILDGGVVAEQGKVEDIFSNPHTDAARRLVYPGGVSLAQYPAGTHAVRVAFNGGTAYQPLIASLAIDLGVKVNILGADTRNIEGRAFGTMLLGLPDDPNEAAKALSYIRAQPNVSAEEVEYHV